MPLLKQVRHISNSKTINTREPLPLNSQPRILAVKTNSMHELTSSESAALQVAYFSQQVRNTTLLSYKSTHGLATTFPFTCPFLCSFSIASHRSLLRRQTWRGLSGWWTACRSKNKSEKPHFTSLFSSLQAPKQSQEHSPFVAANLSLACRICSFLVHGAQSSSTRPGQLRNKAERKSSKHPPFGELAHALFQGQAWTQAPLPEIIRSSYQRLA